MLLPKKTFRSHLSITRLLLFLCLALILTSCSHNSNFPADIALAAYGEREAPIEGPECVVNTTDLKEPSAADESKLNAAVEKAKGEGPFTKEQAEEAIKLIKTGQFYKDIYSVVNVLSVKKVSGIRERIDTDIIDHSTVTCLFTTDKMKCVYRNPTAKDTADTAKILLENDSVRLAIIVYARANGVNLNDEDLNVLSNTALNTEDPDWDGLVDHGVVRLKEENGVDKAEKILLAMKSGKVICKDVDG